MEIDEIFYSKCSKKKTERQQYPPTHEEKLKRLWMLKRKCKVKICSIFV
jgi:hypothetical protein